MEEWQAIARRLKQEARLRLASAAQNPSTTDAYFVPPQHAGGPVSGAPVSGMPVSGMPVTGSSYPAYGGTPAYQAAPTGDVHQYQPGPAYQGPAAIPAPPPAVGDHSNHWRVNNPGAYPSVMDQGSVAGIDQSRWDGGR